MRPIGAVSYTDGRLQIFFQGGNGVISRFSGLTSAEFEAKYPTLPVTTSKPVQITTPKGTHKETWWELLKGLWH